MGKKYYQTEEFLRQSLEWDKKLEEEGFKPLSSFENGTVINPEKFTVVDQEEIGGSNYSKLCSEILENYNFKRDVDYVIFELHSQGKTVRFIESHLSNNDIKNIRKTQISDLIKKIKEDYLKGKK